MDDTARLVSELNGKLSELDGKVAAYQRDMLADFQRHMDDRLKKYPDSVSNKVSRAIAESMIKGKFPAISPVIRAPESPAIDLSAWDGRKSPPPLLRHTSVPRSPHAREKEFHGLFTPTYLPLLESLDRNRSPPISPLPPPPAEIPAETPALPLSIDNVAKVEESKEPASIGHKGWRDPIRRLTDRSTSSLESSGSDSKVRRSALRRSSSIKGSPRRVRFDFEGEEVFPSSGSPQASPALTPASGAEPQPEAEIDTSATAIPDESTTETDTYTGTSLLDVEGEEDWLPRPKKVSSTQALQALTRSPLDEGTVWRVVNPGAEEPAKMNGESKTLSMAQAEVDARAEEAAEDELLREKVLGSPIEELGNYDYDDGNDSEQEFLSMRPKKTPSPTGISPFRPPMPAPSTPSAKTEVNGQNGIDDDQDQLFDFEEEGPKSRQMYLPEPDDDDDDEDVDEITRRRLKNLAKAGEPTPPPDHGHEGPASPSAALFGQSIGSYMGRSINIGPINNPKLYDEIANMKNVQFAVGSLKDLSDGEVANMGSYRATGQARAPMSMSAPRSFTERLALEEAMERRAAEEDDDDDDDDEWSGRT